MKKSISYAEHVDTASYLQKSRTGTPFSLSIWDKGLTGTISRRNSDFSGKTFSLENKARFHRLKTLDSRSKWKSSSERNMQKALTTLDGAKKKLALTDAISEHAAYIYRKAVEKKITQGRRITDILGAAVYCSCREFAVHRSLDVIAKTLNIKKKSLAKCYRLIVQRLEIKPEPPSPESALSKICSTLKAPEKVKRTALKLLRKVQERNLNEGFNPLSVCSAAVYYACLKNDESISQVQIAKAAGITVPSIRNFSQVLIKSFHTDNDFID